MSMRVIECNICGETLVAANDEELLGRLRAHMDGEHSSTEFDEGHARAMVANEAYEASDS